MAVSQPRRSDRTGQAGHRRRGRHLTGRGRLPAGRDIAIWPYDRRIRLEGFDRSGRADRTARLDARLHLQRGGLSNGMVRRRSGAPFLVDLRPPRRVLPRPDRRCQRDCRRNMARVDHRRHRHHMDVGHLHREVDHRERHRVRDLGDPQRPVDITDPLPGRDFDVSGIRGVGGSESLSACRSCGEGLLRPPLLRRRRHGSALLRCCADCGVSRTRRVRRCLCNQ